MNEIAKEQKRSLYVRKFTVRPANSQDFNKFYRAGSSITSKFSQNQMGQNIMVFILSKPLIHCILIIRKLSMQLDQRCERYLSKGINSLQDPNIISSQHLDDDVCQKRSPHPKNIKKNKKIRQVINFWGPIFFFSWIIPTRCDWNNNVRLSFMPRITLLIEEMVRSRQPFIFNVWIEKWEKQSWV